MKRCGKNCSACPYIREVKSLNINNKEWKINQNLNCEISNCIYLIECIKEHCNMKYVGETRRILKFRLAEHRGYSESSLNAAIERARAIPRHIALRRVHRGQTEKRPVFALTYDPRLPPIQSIQAKHWRSMVSQDPYLNEVFSQPPLTAYKRQKNIRDHLIRAKVPSSPKSYPVRRVRGMKRCGKNCSACPYIREVKSLHINRNEWKINQDLNCEISNCIYLIECMKEHCNMKYVGETRRILKFRLAEHRGYVNNNVDTPLVNTQPTRSYTV